MLNSIGKKAELRASQWKTSCEGDTSKEQLWMLFVFCEPEQFESRSSKLIQMCTQWLCTWYLSADKSNVQHMEELSKQGFPVKTCSGLPILDTIFFWSANIKAECDRQPCRGYHLREVEAVQLLITLILWQKHLAVDLTIRETHPCSVLAADPSWADCSGITSYWEERKWKKICFSSWLKISKSEYSITEGAWRIWESPAAVREKAVSVRRQPCKSECSSRSWISAQR